MSNFLTGDAIESDLLELDIRQTVVYHDGHCSDPGKHHVRNKVSKRRMKLPPSFAPSALWKRDGDGILLCPSNPKVEAIIGKFPRRRGCECGSGFFCKGGVTERIIGARIVPKTPRVVVSNDSEFVAWLQQMTI